MVEGEGHLDIVKTKISLSKLVFSGGGTVDLGSSEILVVVGPNNAGKSQLLRDIQSLFQLESHHSYVGKVVKGIEVASPSAGDVWADMQAYQENGTEFYSSMGVRVHKNYVHNAFAVGVNPIKFGPASQFFLKRISPDERLAIVQPSPALGANGPETPGQILYDNEVILNRVSKLFRKSFGKDLFLDYRAGSTIPIYVGDKPKIPKKCDRISDQYVQLVRANDLLHEQGDGMKSFGGIMLSMLAAYNITLVDEPEAFLHPPQERAIGKFIAEEAGGQVICSTHSKSVLQGILQSSKLSVRVGRLIRENNKNYLHEISPEEISTLWKDPIFRYSTALEALFHDRAILCEADPDCRFYEAVEGVIRPDHGPDNHYIPCGGKASYPKFIKALRKLSVPVLAILDLDVLNDEANIKAIYEAQGGSWDEISQLWKRLDAAIRKGVAIDDVPGIKKKISGELDAWTDGPAPVSKIMDILNLRKPWGKIKEGGVNSFPVGDAQKASGQLINKLAEYNVFPVPVGTLEKFVRPVGNHGNKWLNAVFEAYDLSDPELRDAREFMERVLT